MRLRRLEDRYRDRVDLEWRSFLLRPRPDPNRTLEKFRSYTRSWLKPAADDDSGEFRVWQSDEGPPSHSIPAHLVAKAAAVFGDDEFRRMHTALLHAYFHDNRDITSDATLRAIWAECELPDAGFASRDGPDLLQRVLREHNEAQEHGATGVPAVRVEGSAGIIVGAHPYQLYDRWVLRLLAAEAGASPSGG